MYESQLSKEIHRKVFELTRALYRVTNLFPRGEILVRQIRKKANEIFGEVHEYGYIKDTEREAIQILGKIETLRGYLELARVCHFVRTINITVLMREYDFLVDFFVRELENEKERGTNQEKRDSKESKEMFPKKDINKVYAINFASRTQEERKDGRSSAPWQFSKESSQNSLSGRQKKILEYIQNKEQAKISDFSTVFKEISLKTIQRDLQGLVSKNILKKEGDKRWTTYTQT